MCASISKSLVGIVKQCWTQSVIGDSTWCCWFTASEFYKKDSDHQDLINLDDKISLVILFYWFQKGIKNLVALQIEAWLVGSCLRLLMHLLQLQQVQWQPSSLQRRPWSTAFLPSLFCGLWALNSIWRFWSSVTAREFECFGHPPGNQGWAFKRSSVSRWCVIVCLWHLVHPFNHHSN